MINSRSCFFSFSSFSFLIFFLQHLSHISSGAISCYIRHPLFAHFSCMLASSIRHLLILGNTVHGVFRIILHIGLRYHHCHAGLLKLVLTPSEVIRLQPTWSISALFPLITFATTSLKVLKGRGSHFPALKPGIKHVFALNFGWLKKIKLKRRRKKVILSFAIQL